LDYEVKGSQEMFLRGSEIIQEGQYVEVANKNGEVKQFNHSVSCIYQKS
jgi:hypothetical protein